MKTLIPTFEIAAFAVPLHSVLGPRSSPLILVCLKCRRRIAPDSLPFGAPLADAANHSHGVCHACLPAYARQLGLSAQATARLARRVAHDPSEALSAA